MPTQRLSTTIRTTLTAYATQLAHETWHAKERDHVTRYALEHLVPACGPQSAIKFPLQIGIEIPVPSPLGIRSRPSVNKDLVIWPKPKMTTWTKDYEPVHTPRAILEWKVTRGRRAAKLDAGDLEFIETFAKWARPPFAGFVVQLSTTPDAIALQVGRYTANAQNPTGLFTEHPRS